MAESMILKAERNRRYIRKLKLECFTIYGGAFCRRCGKYHDVEPDLNDLELHHIEGGGNVDRDEKLGLGLSSPGGYRFYVKLRALGWPDKDKFEVICVDCHDAIHGRAKKENRKKGPPGYDDTRCDDVALPEPESA